MKKFNFAKIIERIEFSKQELCEIDEEVDIFKKRLKKAIGNKKIGVFIGGSYAKGTMLKKGKVDIDVFVIFSEDDGNLSGKLKKVLLKSGFKFTTIHGSRDYFQVLIKGITYEIVPIYKINKASESKNITDISPLHVKWLLKKIVKKNSLAREIMLAKSFCYSQNCYGAESYISGFSGYALEVLVCYYGSFMNFLKNSRKWKIDNTKKIIIDPERYYKNEGEILKSINKSKQEGPIILIDPVQKERNVCAALNKKTLENFISIAKKFIKNPNESFFTKKEIDFKKWQAKKNVFIIRAKTSKNKVDIAGAKLKKFFNFLVHESEKQGFKIIKREIDFDEDKLEAKLYMIVEKCGEIIVKGPPTNIDKKFIKAFKKRWPDSYEKAGKLYAKTYCKFKDFDDFLKNLKKEDILKQMKIKSVDLVGSWI